MESGLVRFHPSGTISAYVGTFDQGQGHRTSFAQVLADELGVPIEDIEVVDGDTEMVPAGTGTYGSRSAIAGGNALAKSAQKVVESARKIAAHHLESGVDDIEFVDGEFHVAGAPDRSIAIQEVARRSYMGEVTEGTEWGLEATTFIEPVTTYPFGTHVAVVEVDPGTGEIEILRYAAVDDCGEQLNPMIVEGQVHGGIAQGIGVALHEGAVYEDGRLATRRMDEYSVPHSTQLPEYEAHSTETPSPHNPIGVKGVGESATIGATPTIVSAVTDALEPFGVEHLDMPITPEKVWRATGGDD
jgi:carbon-monoxide dehydrogenase large subunit